MGKKVIRGGLIIKGTLASGSGDDLLTIDATTGEVGKISGTPLTTTLTAGQVFLGNSSNVATATAFSGDVTVDSSGVTAIGSGVIVNADVNASAAIAHSKMAALTASRALVSDGSGVVSVSSVTSTELGYVSGVTSAIQTQINGKQATITGAATTITSSDLTANRALLSNASGKVAVSSVTNTELGYLSGVTSAIQTQFSGKLSATISGAATGDIIYYNGTNWVNLPRGTNGQALYSTATSIQWDTPTINGIPIGGTAGQVLAKQSGTDFDSDWTTLTVSSITDLTATAAELNVLDGITATVTELNYTDGVTSNIQTQLDGKQSSSLAHNAIWVGNSSGVAAAVSPGTNGYVLTSVSGTPTWQPVSAGTVPGSDTQVLFNDGGSFGADAGMTYNKTLDSLTVKNFRILEMNGTSYFLGFNAGNSTTSGSSDIAIGNQALTGVTSGASNIAIGSSALNDVTTGSGNIWIGQDNTTGVTTGNDNIVIGRHSVAAVTSITTGSNNILIGSELLAQTPTSDGQLSIANAIFGTGNTGTGTTVSTGNIGIGGPPVTDKVEVWHSGTQLLGITTDGRLYGTALHNNAGAVTGTTNQYVASGTYTPTLTNVSNLDASTAYTCQWMRVGNVVTVSGKVDVDATASGTLGLGISLPIASNFSAVSGEQCAGTANTSAATSVAGAIYGDSTNDRAHLAYNAATTANHNIFFTFTYLVI